MAETDLGGRAGGVSLAYTSAGGGMLIDYDQLAEAVARGNEAAGLGNFVIGLDGKQVGERTERYSSRASMLRSQRSIKGRTSRLALV